MRRRGGHGLRHRRVHDLRPAGLGADGVDADGALLHRGPVFRGIDVRWSEVGTVPVGHARSARCRGALMTTTAAAPSAAFVDMTTHLGWLR